MSPTSLTNPKSEKRADTTSPTPLVSPVHSPPHDSPPWSLTIKIIVAVVAMLLVVLVIWRFQSLIAPLVMACILAYLLNPLINQAIRWLKLSRGMAVLVVYGLLLLVAVGGGIALGYVAFDQASRLINLLPENIEEAAQLIQEEFSTLSQRTIAVGPYDIGLTNLPPELSLQSLAQQAVDLLSPLFSGGGSLAAQVAQATISGISIGFLVYVLSIYIARDTPKIWLSISNIATQPGYRADADRLVSEFSRIWDAYLRGQVILALVIGIIVSIMLGILGVNSALGLGALSGILEFLPIVGPFVGTTAAVLVAFFQSDTFLGMASWQFALLVAALMGLVQALENNILVPRIVGDALDLHPLVVMVSVIMGASLAGILGAVLAAPVVATIKLLGSYAWRKMLDLPPFPDEPTTSQADLPTAPWYHFVGLRTWLEVMRESELFNKQARNAHATSGAQQHAARPQQSSTNRPRTGGTPRKRTGKKRK